MTKRGRPRQHSTDELIRIVNQYYASEAFGCPEKLRFSSIARYATTHGFDLKESSFRRCDAVLEHIEKLKSGESSVEGIPAVCDFVPVDIEKLLDTCRDFNDIIECLKDLNEKCSNYAAKVMEQRNTIIALNLEHASLQQENQFLKMNRSQTCPSDDYRILTHENKKLKAFIRTHIYPDIAESLLSLSQGEMPDPKVLTAESVNELIETDAPKPIPGQEKEETSKENVILNFTESLKRKFDSERKNNELV